MSFWDSEIVHHLNISLCLIAEAAYLIALGWPPKPKMGKEPQCEGKIVLQVTFLSVCVDDTHTHNHHERGKSVHVCVCLQYVRVYQRESQAAIPCKLNNEENIQKYKK